MASSEATLFGIQFPTFCRELSGVARFHPFAHIIVIVSDEGANGAAGLNVAVTDFAASMVTVHVAVPVHAPLQPVKIEPAAAVAVSVTEAPLA